MNNPKSLELRLVAIFAALFLILSNAWASPPAAEASRDFSLSLLPKKPLVRSKLGTNAFVNDGRFGSIRNQMREVKNTLKLRHIRVLFAWNDQVQSSPNIDPDFAFYDQIVRFIPSGVKALVIVTGTPSWMNSSANWTTGDPRGTWLELWLKKVVARYGKKRRIVGFEIINEPNWDSEESNTTLEILESPENYLEILRAAYAEVKKVAPKKLVIGAATTSINQNYPDTINYNKALRDLGAEGYLDVWAIHYYSTKLETVLLPGGVADYLESLGKPIWVTESGAKGTTSQLNYAQRVWPFLLGLDSKIKRIYQYQFTEDSTADNTYGLRNLTPGRSVSDLYIHLRDK